MTTTRNDRDGGGGDSAKNERERVLAEQQQRDDPQTKRIRAEYNLVSDFLAIFGRHRKSIVQQRRQTEDMLKVQQEEGHFSSHQEYKAHAMRLVENTPQLTEAEQRILSRAHYQNWTAGFIAGATTFGVLMGFSHWSARRLAARQGILPPAPKKSYTNLDNAIKNKHQHRTTTKPAATTQQSYQHMDRKAFLARREQKRVEESAKQSWAIDPSSSVLPSSSLLNRIISKPSSAAGSTTEHDVMPQIQMMVYGGMAIVVTILTSWFTIDKKQHHVELAKLPLAPGKSYLCHDACPEVVHKYQKIMASSFLSSTTREKEEDPSLSTNPATILKNPVTEEAEALSRLVINCQQRMQYEKDHAPNGDADGGGTVVVVDVPEPGVPSNYSGISIGSSSLEK